MTDQAERLNYLFKEEDFNEQKVINNFIAFSSGKGGTGKTFLSLNIAYALSKLNKKVLIIDLDLNYANLNLLVNKISKKNISDLLSNNLSIKDLIYEYNPNLDFIFGVSGEYPLLEFDNKLMSLLLAGLNSIKDEYDFIFLDTASGGNKYQIKFLSSCGINILVSTPEPTSVMDSYVIIKMLNRLNYNGKKLLIINKAENPKDIQETYNNINTAAKHFLNDSIKTIASVNNDKLVSTSIAEQNLYLDLYPDSPITSQIFEAAQSLFDFSQMANIKQTYQTHQN